MAFWQWSKTAATNANSDPTINYAEGMPPGSVNDSARAGMARLAEYGADTSGSLLTAGISTAYTVTTNQGFSGGGLSALDKQKLKVRFGVANGPAATLSVDGLTASPLQIAQGTAAPIGAIQANSIWDVTYDNSIPAFLLSSGIAAASTPIGAVMDFAGSAAPSLWLLCAGQAVSRTTYAALFAVISTTFGPGDGSTTFNVPDYRGRIGAGVDNMGGSAASRIGSVVTDNGTIVGTTLGSTGGSSTHAQASGELATHNHSATDSGHTHSVTADDNTNVVGGVNGGNAGTFALFNTSTPAHAITSAGGTANISVANAGSSTAMAWLQPTIMMNKIIFAGV